MGMSLPSSTNIIRKVWKAHKNKLIIIIGVSKSITAIVKIEISEQEKNIYVYVFKICYWTFNCLDVLYALQTSTCVTAKKGKGQAQKT